MAAAPYPNAYYIGGHGGEGAKTFTVPAGCVLVIKAKPGEYTVREKAQAYMRDLFCEPSDAFFRPVEEAAHVVSTFGSVAIYKEGDECPNYRYKLFGGYWRKRGYSFNPSAGLIPVPVRAAEGARLCRELQEARVVTASKKQHASSVLPRFYRHSIQPTMGDVAVMIDELEDTVNNALNFSDPRPPPMYHVTMEELLDDDDSPFYDLITVTLSDLLQIDARGQAGRPGVYYSFSCRGDPNVDIYDLEMFANKDTRYVPSHGDMLPVVSGPKAAAKAAQRVLLLRAIEEAELRRKGAIRGSRFNRATRRASRSGSGSGRSRSRSGRSGGH